MPDSLIDEQKINPLDDKVAFWAESLQSSILVISENEEVLYSNATCARDFHILKNEFVIFEKQKGAINRIRKLKDPIAKDNWIKVSSLLDLEYKGVKAHLVILEKSALLFTEEEPSKSNDIEPLLGIMPGVVYRCNNDEKRMMHFLSEGCYQLTGYPAETLQNKKDFPFSKIIHSDDYWRTWKEIQTALSENRPYRISYRIKHASGEIRTVQEQGKGVFNQSGKVVALEGWIIDISEQQKIEDALIESETQYRNLVEISPDGVVLVDPDGKLIFSNQQLAILLGVEGNHFLVGKSVMDFMTPASRQNVTAALAGKFSSNNIHRNNYQIQRINGEVIPAEASIRAIRDKDGTAIAYIAIIRDISDREETLQALKNSEARYRAIVEDNPEMIVRFKPNGVITFVNQAFCSFARSTSAQLIGDKLTSVPSDEFKKIAERQFAYLTPDMAAEINEYCVMTKPTDPCWFRWKTQPIRNDEGHFIEYQTVGEDITDEKKAEQANIQSEQHLRTLMESIKLIAIITDVKGNITFCNSHFLEKTGWHKEDAMGKNWYEHFVPTDSAGQLMEELIDQAQEGEIPQRNENMILTRSGEQIMVSWNNTLLKDDQGNVTAIASIGEDITEKYYNEKAQAIIYKIAQSTITSKNLDELFQSIHAVLLDLMPAENFFIALYDDETDTVSFPYFVDQYDPPPPPRRAGNGLTEHIIRTGKPILANPESFNRLEHRGDAVNIGTPSVDWIGIPLLIENHTIGVMAVQSYSEETRFKKRDEQMLTFVSAQVAIAIERKRAEQALSTSTKRNELLIQASTDCIFLESLSGEILECNNVAEEVFGYTREELLTMNVTDLVTRDFTADKPDYVTWQIEQGGHFSNIPNVKKDGIIFPVEISTKITDIEGTRFAVAYVRDITERKKTENAILESEAKFKALAQTAAAGIFINRDDQFLYVNPMWCEITGFTEPELLNTSLWKVINHGDGGAVRQKYNELLRTESGMIRFETSFNIRTGEQKWLDVTAGFIDYQGEKATIGTAIDITNRKQREHDLEVVAKIGEALRTDLTREKVRTTILAELMDLLSIEGAIISTIEDQKDLPNLVRAVGCWQSIDNRQLKANEGLTGFIVSSCKPYVNINASHDAYFAFPELISNLVTLAGVPLVAKGETIGSIIIGANRLMSENELRLLKTIGDLAASAIHRSDLYEQTSVQATELKRAYDATLEGWAHALELRDKETQGHSLRIANMTLELAKRMGIDDLNLDNIRRGALLHDIGKMGVPDTILLKPGKLTEDEWSIMQKHPTYAYEMLSELPYFKDVLDIPYCHHEWWDGTGYPRGLKGEQIPLSARIFAIVDAWDALVSDRPYRKAWTKQNALKHLVDQAGTHFDEEVVTAFAQMMADNA
jgi:PAS domain S-box-containing protein/putative nucleotidyltransferase with HDIG domain